jgi:hypothetical protein
MWHFDCNEKRMVEEPNSITDFLNEIESVCKKHGFSISHEDGHGAFEIEPYSDYNINWLRDSNLRLK